MIQILTTGGTIDKIYNPLTGELIFSQSYVEEMLERANLTTQTQVQHLLQKDSLEMNEADRELIYKTCEQSEYEQILITHGTDTMTQTAQYLRTVTNKTIVLFGAMIPYSINNSDAFFNFGHAMSCVQHLPHGVYIAMNGEVFPAGGVQKNTQLGRFEKV